MKAIAVVCALFVAAQAVLIPNLDKIVAVHKGFPDLETAPEEPDARIVRGFKATRGQFPYQVALVLDWSNFCGGSLISPRWVLSSGRCANGTSVFTAILGTSDLSVVEDGFAIRVTMKNIIHPSYDSRYNENDVSLIDLEYEVQLTQYINTIKIASGSKNYVGTLARAIGWGVSKSDSSTATHSTTLNYIDVSVINNDVCEKSYRDPIDFNTTICVSNVNGGTGCTGDLGGPLIDPASGVQIGVMSFFIKGCRNTASDPFGYTQVNSFASWIFNITGIKEGNNIKSCIDTCFDTYQQC